MKIKNLEARTISWALVPRGESICDMRGFTVSIEDDNGGEYVKVVNHNDDHDGITIDPDEWHELQALINVAVSLCRHEDGDVMKEAKP